ncbi:cell division protein FtsA [Neorickettsia helminthoeca str. Oregon]|uniref:Cell division protein FtsA n=1 Tax=Neorickettsia helminthoeca str. Oregon TaxID=1286528 RepID=X5H457_9RICK|nr:cell division protein FtsA [Neorickettsia helminthoeca]AHX11351.1 cell division protein FtsA [Neorickettsia helminthoeca str. Oregon]
MEIRPQSLRDKAHVTILDLGSDKLRCMNFNLINSSELEVTGFAEVPAVGIKGGIAINIEKAKRSLLGVIEATEKVSDEGIEDIYIIISDPSITGKQYRAKLEVDNKKISEVDAELLRKKVAEKISTPIIHMVQQECLIDGVQEVSNPIGMYGKSLSASFYVITGIRTMMLNLENLISQCNLRFAGCAFSPYVSGYSVLSEDEREVGAIIVEMGAASTSMAVFKSGKVQFISSIPVGGSHVSKDIAFGLNVGISIAESLKKDCAHLLLDRNSESNRIDISGYSDLVHQQDVSIREIADMAVPRLEEIFEMAHEKVKDSNFSTVVLTGGGSKITQIRRIAEKIFMKKVRVQGDFRVRDVVYGSEYSSVFGLAAILRDFRKESMQKKPIGYIRRILEAVSIRIG